MQMIIVIEDINAKLINVSIKKNVRWSTVSKRKHRVHLAECSIN